MIYALFKKIFMTAFFLCCLSYANADEINNIFEINTTQFQIDGTKIGALVGAKLIGVTPVSAGKSSDIVCEGISDAEGKISCQVQTCDHRNVLKRYYYINFEPHTSFGEVSPALIFVKNCKVSPVPAEARFMERVIITRMINEDTKFIFGTTQTDYSLTLAEGVTVSDYSYRLSDILNKPFGAYRAERIRRKIQDASFIAHQDGKEQAAVLYQKLVTTHANTLLKFSVENAGYKALPIEGSPYISNVSKNVEIILNTSPPDAFNDLENKWVENDLKEIKTSSDKGILANIEFKKLEKLVILSGGEYR